MTSASGLRAAGCLGEAQRSFYRSNGYLVLPQAVPTSFLDGVQGQLEALVDERIAAWHRVALISETYQDLPFDSRLHAAWIAAGRPRSLVTADDQGSFARAVADHIRADWLVGLATELTGAVDLAALDSCFYRARIPGDPSTSLPWHQDAPCLAEISGVDFITAWIPLVDVSDHNSCLEVSPIGEGQRKFRPEWSERFGYYFMHESEVANLTETRAIPMRRGDLLLFSPYLPHRPLDNTSGHIRWSVDFRYAPT